jgi:hypothetical protein
MLGGLENVPVTRRIRPPIRENGWRHLPSVVTVLLSFTASDGLETAQGTGERIPAGFLAKAPDPETPLKGSRASHQGRIVNYPSVVRVWDNGAEQYEDTD